MSPPTGPTDPAPAPTDSVPTDPVPPRLARAVEAAYRLAFTQVGLRTDPELAHQVGVAGIRLLAPLLRSVPPLRRALAPPPSAALQLAGVRFPGRFGLAAGFDKSARGVTALTALGFAFVEVGTVTARPQRGNDRPRLWRVPERGALRNRMGFNNDGAAAVADRLRRVRSTAAGRRAVIGVNIGKSRLTPLEDAADDYAVSAALLAPLADYLVVNVSSPNTPGLRDLQAVGALRPVLQAVQHAVAQAATSRVRPTARAAGPPRPVPVLVKISPDLADDDVDAIADLVVELHLAGLVAVNTTIDHDLGPGGLSGPPLRARGLQVVARLRARLGPGPLLVGVGGVREPDDARAYVRAGADLVQGYTGFVYTGPLWAARLNRALADTPADTPADTATDAPADAPPPGGVHRDDPAVAPRRGDR